MSSDPEPAQSPSAPPAAGPASPTRRVRGLQPLWSFIGAVLTGAAGAGLLVYGARGLVGASVVSSWLRQQGVASELRIDRLDATGFSGSVRLGDPHRPDFVSDHVELAFTPALGLGSARIVEPRLRARFDGRRLTFGSLQPLIDRALAGKPSSAPGPHIQVERGRAAIDTPYGQVRVAGDVELAQSRLVRLELSLAPTRLAARVGEVTITSGRLLARGVPGGVRGRLSVSASTARFGGDSLNGFSMATDVDAATTGFIPHGAMRLKGGASAGRAVARAYQLTDPTLRWDVRGAASGSLEQLTLEGGGRVTLSVSRVNGRDGLGAAGAEVALASPGFHLARGGSTARLDGPLTIDARAGRLAGGGATLLRSSMRTRLRRLTARLDGGGIRAEAEGDIQIMSGQAHLGGTVLDAVELRATGRARAAPDGPARFDGGLTLAAASNPSQARRWTGAVPLFAPQLARALTRVTLSAPMVTLARGREGDLTLASVSPVRVGGASGAVLTVTPGAGSPLAHVDRRGAASGALDLRLSGGGLPTARLLVNRYALGRDRDGLAGSLVSALRLNGDVGAARGLALDTAARVERHGGITTARLDRCSPIKLARFGEVASNVTATVCPTKAPLLRVAGGRWGAEAEVREARGVLEAGNVKLSGAATLSANNDRGAASAKVELARVDARDLEAKRRFEPLAASGRIDLGERGWRGGVHLALADGRALGEARLTAATDGSVGEARLDTGVLAFAQNGLQPSAISPLAPNWLSKIDGPARFTGKVAWRGRTLDTSGRLETAGLDATGPLGRVTRARGALQFTSLLPLTTAPGQTVTAERVAWIVPLSEVRLRFQLLPDAVRLASAEAMVSSGQVSLDPLTVALAPGSSLSGVLRLSGVDVGELIARSTLSDKLSLAARLSGAIPFQTGPESFRITNGRLAADGPGRLSLNRKALTAGAVQTPVGQDLAYQALEDLAFEQLDATVNSLPGGRLGVLFHIKGRHDPPRLKEARVSLFDLLAGRALQKPLDLPSGTPVNLTLDTSLNFDELLAAYRQADRRGSEPVQDNGAK